MGTFKITPTERSTGNTAPSFFVEARTDKEAAKNAVSKSRVLEFPEWKAETQEFLPKGGGAKKRRNKKPFEREKMLILPNKKAA